LAARPPGQRWLIKAIMLAVYTLIIFFPRPDQFIRQVPRWQNPDSLIETNVPFLAEVNLKIDEQLKPDSTKKEEIKAVEKFVYREIKYGYDWDVWGNTDYWPTVSEVWANKLEDCDGQAVLAASILKSRGFPDVRIVGNLSHVWVATGTNEVMSPQADKNFQRVGGKLKVRFPGMKTFLLTWAHINRFPAVRSLLLLMALLVMALHPVADVKRWWMTFGVGAAGLLLLYDWGGKYLKSSANGASLDFWAGNILVLLAIALAFWTRPKTTSGN
jgi:predicted transglutaminase-like cysteine proteinase